ncbi:hypothetical protein ACFOSV_00440 [Algoriphagus namhaensis]|uniref:Uncharacterized protein n=1 Tax=Algoriphagus namhaensis TaxID=915353 RepID=A0ABV8ALV9_9BACT
MKRYWTPIILALWACGGDEPSPREFVSISIPEVIAVDEKGAEFQARVTGLGTEEVLEYGFVWSQNSRPLIDTDPKVYRSGNPPTIFSLRAESDMLPNRSYNVASYLRTSTRIIYSEPTDFISKGSSRIVFLGVDTNDEVYFEDTVRVLVSNLKREDQAKMKLSFEGVEVPFFDYTPDGFSFEIPRDFNTTFENMQGGVFDLQVKLDQQTFDYELSLKFRKPQFQEKRVLKYADEWAIKGDYLFSQSVSVSYILDGQTINFQLTEKNDNEIRFVPRTFFKEKNPVFLVNIRDQIFEVDQIEISDSDILPGQNLIPDDVTKLYSLKVDNLNILGSSQSANYPLLFFDPVGLKAQYYSNELDRMSFTVYAVGPVSGRSFRVFANNFGQNSSTFATGVYAHPALPRFDLPEGLQEYFNVPGQTIGSKAYFLNKGKIFEFASGQFALVTSTDLSSQEETLFEKVQDKIYFTSFSTEGSKTGLPFYSFDPVSGQTSRKSNFPREGVVLGSFVWDNEIHVYLRASVQGETKVLTLRYRVSADAWVEEIEENPAFQNYFNTFNFGDKLMAFSADRGALLEWDALQKSWRTVEFISSFNLYHKFSVEVIGDMAYFHIPNNGLFAYDLNRRDLEIRVNSDLFHSQSLVKVNGKMVMLGAVNRFFLYEIDEEYF